MLKDKKTLGALINACRDADQELNGKGGANTHLLLGPVLCNEKRDEF